VAFKVKFCVCQDNFRKFSTFESIFHKLEQVVFPKVLSQTERCDWFKASVLVNNMEWSDEKVLRLTYIDK